LTILGDIEVVVTGDQENRTSPQVENENATAWWKWHCSQKYWEGEVFSEK